MSVQILLIVFVILLNVSRETFNKMNTRIKGDIPILKPFKGLYSSIKDLIELSIK